MSLSTRTKPPDITSANHAGDTWNDCPRCGKNWKDRVATLGVIHRTQLCDGCKADDDYFKYGSRYPGQ